MNEDESPQNPLQQKQESLTLEKLTHLSEQLNRSLSENTNLRMKYPGEPDKFYESEEAIHLIIEQLSSGLSAFEIPLVMQSKVLVPLIRVLEHPNVDLSMGVIGLLHELMEEEPSDDKIFEAYYRMGIWLIENSCIESMVPILSRLREEENLEEYEIALQILKLLQLLTNLHDSAFEVLVEQRAIFEYMANRIMPNFKTQHKLIDDNKYVSTDILISLLSNSSKAQQIFSSFSGVEILLEAISAYETKLPEHTDEKESLSNMFQCLSVLLFNHLLPQNIKIYHQLKGNYLMISFLKSKSEYSSLALKVISNSLTNLSTEQEVDAVHQIITDGGLKYVFAIFRRKGIRGSDFEEQKDIDENALRIIYCLSRASEQVFKDRVQHKFTENKCENLERIFTLFTEYSQNITTELSNEQQTKASEQYISKIQQGLSLIEYASKIALVLVHKFSRLRFKIKEHMNVNNIKVESLERVMNEHYKFIGVENEKIQVEGLLSINMLSLKKLFSGQEQQHN